MSTGPRNRRGTRPGGLALGGLASALVTARAWAAQRRAEPAGAEAAVEAEASPETEAPPEVIPAGPAPAFPLSADERPPAPARAPTVVPAPVPVPVPVPPAVPQPPPAAAAPFAAVDELAEVTVWRGYVKAQFYAQPIVRGAPEPYALALSPLFRPKGKTVAETPAAREALDRLVATMEAFGWIPIGSGPEWYRVRFRRPFDGVPASVSTV